MRIDISVDLKSWSKESKRQRKKLKNSKMGISLQTANSIANKARIYATERIKYSSSGKLVAGINSRRTFSGAVVESTAKHSRYFEEGTGVYNPNGRSTPWVYFHRDLGLIRTMGQEPKWFLRDALKDTIPKINKMFKIFYRR